MKALRAALSAVLVLAVSAVVVVDTSGPANAFSASDWDPGFIVSDQQFYDYAAMTPAQIQSFLEAKLKETTAGRCQPERSMGSDDPIICLKDFRMNTADIAPDSFCPGGYKGAPNELASTIIAKAAAGCRVSPKVILITLQKEMGLVTHTWPSSWRYDKATGYACPDTAPCDPAYAGFQKQIYYGVRQFQRYRVNPTSYNHRAGVVNYVRYHPSSSCGGTNVLIRNQATAGLYNYTPYQPNAAALSNMWGTGNSCSSYGNRNFWRQWWTWFGDPHATGALVNAVEVDRVQGQNRYGTAAALFAGTPANPDVVYVASGENFPDALAVAPIASSLDAPLLLVRRDWIPPETITALQNLKPTKIVIIGGTGAVTTKVSDLLKGYASAGGVERIGGADRYETARLAVDAQWEDGTVDVLYVASGRSYPDALSSASAAGATDSPVLIVDGSQPRLDAASAELIAKLGPTKIVVAGGPTIVPDGVVNDLKTIAGVTTVSRLFGADRYATSAALNNDAFGTATEVFIASGENYPDALAGAARSGSVGAPLYLVRGTCIPASVAGDVNAFGAVDVTMVGGTGVLKFNLSSVPTCK